MSALLQVVSVSIFANYVLNTFRARIFMLMYSLRWCLNLVALSLHFFEVYK